MDCFAQERANSLPSEAEKLACKISKFAELADLADPESLSRMPDLPSGSIVPKSSIEAI
jgi:hypothetical protein